MKKILTATLILALLLSLTGCCCCSLPFLAGSEDESSSSADYTTQPDNAEIVAFVEASKDDLIYAMEEAFSGSSGLTCTSDIWVDGMGIVISVNINELDDLDPTVKGLYQEVFDAMQYTFDEALAEIQTELPEVEYLEILVCEADGDLIADIVAGEK